MQIDLKFLTEVLQYAMHRSNPEARVVFEENSDSDDGQTYRLICRTYHDAREGRVFRADARSNLFLDYPNGFAVYEASDVGTLGDDQRAITVRVGKIGEAEKQRIRVAANGVEGAMPASNSLQGIYDSLRKLDSTLPEFHTLTEAKLKIFISQIVTLRMTLKM